MSIQDELRNHLHYLFPDAKDNGAKTEVMINCPLCKREGHEDHGHHMYISLGYKGAPQYNCFKDSTHKGLLTKEALSSLVDNPVLINDDLMDKLKSNSKREYSKVRYTIRNNGKYNFKVSPYIREEDELKRQYICKRLGLNLSFDELLKDKIVFSLTNLIKYNYINQLTRNEYIINCLDKYFVGFLTNNNSSIIFRNITSGDIKLPESISDRYVKYKLFNNNPFFGYYIIPSLCNLYDMIQIHLAEGTFDILSVFYNLRDANRNNNVYISIGGNTYEKVIEYCICELGIVNAEFHIYIDNDIKKYVLPNIQRTFKNLEINIWIHVNTFTGEKDFGVDKNHIREYVYKLV